MRSATQVQQQFETALESLVKRLQQDRQIIAAILFGSLSYDSVWEKSDIDLMLNSRQDQGKAPERVFCLTENDVNIHASISTRSQFKKMVDGSLRSSFMHSSFSKSRLLFSHDESINELYDSAQTLGARDRQTQLFSAGSGVIPCLYKAEKFLHIKNDPHYAFIWITYTYPSLAKIETYLDNQIAGREVIQQAIALNPEFFKAIYTDLLDRKKTTKTIAATLAAIDQYMTDRIPVLFQPVLDYLAAAPVIRSATQIDTWAENELNVEGATNVCEWLADKGVIIKASEPVRLTPKSSAPMEELAFYYDGE